MRFLAHNELRRCPHCKVARPYLDRVHSEERLHVGESTIERCRKCERLIMVFSDPKGEVTIYPNLEQASEHLPSRAKDYLDQAMSCVDAPAGSVILSASAVDSMLKAKGLTEGSLHSRIEAAATNQLITADMKDWAHEVRLPANEQRHSDEDVELPTSDDAERSIMFAKALGEFLFVLPAKVAAGRTSRAKVPEPIRTIRDLKRAAVRS